MKIRQKFLFHGMKTVFYILGLLFFSATACSAEKKPITVAVSRFTVNISPECDKNKETLKTEFLEKLTAYGKYKQLVRGHDRRARVEEHSFSNRTGKMPVQKADVSLNCSLAKISKTLTFVVKFVRDNDIDTITLRAAFDEENYPNTISEMFSDAAKIKNQYPRESVSSALQLYEKSLKERPDLQNNMRDRARNYLSNVKDKNAFPIELADKLEYRPQAADVNSKESAEKKYQKALEVIKKDSEAAAKCFREIREKLQIKSFSHFLEEEPAEINKKAPVHGRIWAVPGTDIVMVPLQNGDEKLYWIGESEVSVADFKQYLDEVENADKKLVRQQIGYVDYRDHSSFQFSKDFSIKNKKYKNKAVIYISISAAKSFAKWLTLKERKAKRIPNGYVYRIPTVNEWLFAAKTGESKASDSPSTHLSDCKTGKKSRIGLYNMMGNVREWCTDEAGKKTYNCGTSYRDDKRPSAKSSDREIRDEEEYNIEPKNAKGTRLIGFRLVLSNELNEEI